MMLSFPLPALAQTMPFSDDFSSYSNKNVCIADGSSVGPWTNAFSGYGCVKIGTDGAMSWLEESPAVSASPSETHAALALGPSFSSPFVYSVNVRTLAQLRQGSAPNPWEVGWVLWNYADNTHFYYFQVKPNGWELGKEDTAYPGAQRFLATGPTPAFPIGAWYSVQITQKSNVISVSVNGQSIVSFTDNERPYIAGRIGLYNEDSHVEFTKISVTGPTPVATIAPAPTAPAATPVVTAPRPSAGPAQAPAAKTTVSIPAKLGSGRRG